MNTKERFELYCEMISCKYPLRFWRCSRELALLETTCEDPHIWEVILDKGMLLEKLRAHFQESDRPVLFDTRFGVLWGAACTADEVYVIGPVRGLEGNLTDISAEIRALISQTLEGTEQSGTFIFQNRLVDALSRLPVLSSSEFGNDLAMLHCCLTGERLGREGIELLQRDAAESSGATPPLRDRHQTWMMEQALMRMVREGDLNYKAVLARSGSVSKGVPVKSKDPMQQARFSCVTFISLCTRAAIEGGLTPEEAYTVGDGYIQQVEDSLTVTDLMAVNQRMYEDFVNRVHKSRTNPRLSPRMQACRDYIELHLEEPLSLGQLAQCVGYSEYYLSRKFKQEIGISINDYIKCARVERAKLLLISTDEPVREIAKRLRFCSGSYLSQVFQEVTGVRPQEYRAQHQKQ